MLSKIFSALPVLALGAIFSLPELVHAADSVHSEATNSGNDLASILRSLLLLIAAAKLFAEIFTRLRQPAVVGEILAGLIVGPHVLNWVAPSEASHLLAELGVIFLLFSVGLETRPSAILRVGGQAAIVALLGVALPLAAGWALMHYAGHATPQALFVGAAMVATSVGITARVLAGLGLLETRAARIILGAAIIDDVLGLLVLAGVTGIAEGGFDPWKLIGTATLAFGFVALIALVGAPLMTRATPHVRQRLRQDNEFFALALVLCFGLAVAAMAIGVAAIIGAFLAGLALAQASEEHPELRQQIHGVSEFTGPFFLAGIGLQLDPSVFADMPTLKLALGLTVLAVLTKLLGCGLGVIKDGWRVAAQVGVGMIPRGEVGIVVAQMGLALGVIDASMFAATLFMACATTLLAPPLIVLVFGQAKPAVTPPEH